MRAGGRGPNKSNSPSIISYIARKKKFPSLLSNNSHAIHKDQIFDDEIDHKCCLKNMSRFLTDNIGFLKIWIILQMKRNSER